VVFDAFSSKRGKGCEVCDRCCTFSSKRGKGCEVTIVADSESSLKAIRSYMSEPNERKRMRQSGRPLLRLIAYQVLARLQAGASVTFQHEKSHTNAATCESRGNACADYWAEQMRQPATERVSAAEQRWRALSSQIKQLEVVRGEEWVCVRDRAMKSVVMGDVRRAAQKQQSVQNLWAWMCSPTQGAYADERVSELCSEVFNDQQARPMRMLMLILTNIVHHRRIRKSELASFASSSSSSSSSCSFVLS
jgi:ribonuclease HI